MASVIPQWRGVSGYIAPELLQRKSMGSSIGEVGKALLTLGANTKADNMSDLKNQLAHMNSPQDMAQQKEGLLGTLGMQGRSIDQASALEAIRAREEGLRLEQESTQARGAQDVITRAKLSGVADPQVLFDLAQGAGIGAQRVYLAETEAMKQAALQQKQRELDTLIRVQEHQSKLGSTQANTLKTNAETAEIFSKNPTRTDTQTVYGEGGVSTVSREILGAAEIAGQLGALGGGLSAVGAVTPIANTNTGGNYTSGSLPPDVRAGIIQGESKGDYNALYANSHKGSGKFAGMKPTEMTLGQILEFTKQGGEYAEWSKTQKGIKPGTYATPVGAYQVVGSTLGDAVKALNLPKDTKFTPEVQDKIADWVAENQGLSAFAGYKGPVQSAGGQPTLSAVGKQTTQTGGIIDTNHIIANSQKNLSNAFEELNIKGTINKASVDPRAAKAALDKYVDENDLRGNHTYRMMVNDPLFKKLPAEEFLPAMKAMVDYGKKNSSVMGGVNLEKVRQVGLSALDTTNTAKANEARKYRVTNLVNEAKLALNGLRKENPSLTLESVMKQLNKETYNEYLAMLKETSKK